MSQDRWLTRGQKLQLYTVIALAILSSLIYTLLGLMNGFSTLNEWILNQKIALFYLTLLAVSIAPIYRRTDDKLKKIVKQLSFTSALFIVFSPIVWIYFFVNEPSTWVEKLAHRVSYVIFAAGFFGAISSYYYKNKLGGED
ncbi:hypothetical protein ACM16X_02625 [Haloarcula japonica]|uniref:hypothetical protein n=1 Tax=Haloarcula japonica TaxID=29282 RepID=UPI0039F65FEF